MRCYLAMVEALNQSVRMQSMLELVQFMPCLELPLELLMPRNKQLIRNMELRSRYATKQLEEHKRTLNREHPRDYIDVYLTTMYEKREQGVNTTFDGQLMGSVRI